jgi:hypothetical protein
MNITARGIYMSSAALANKPNTIQQGFRYEWVEQYILMFLHELLPTLKSLDKPNTAPELERIRKDIVEKHNFCEKLKDQIKRTMSMTFADMLLEAENDLKALQAEEIKLLSETSFAELDYDLTNKSPEFRSKLKVAISRLLDKSYIIVFEQPDRSKVCLIQLHIKGMAHPKQICLRHKYHTDKVFFSWSYRRKWEPKKDSPQPPADYFTKPWTGQDLRYYPWTDASQSEQWEEAQADKALLERRKRIAAKRKGIK